MDPTQDRNWDREDVLSVDPETFRSIDISNRNGLEVLCDDCCCISANFAGHRNGGQKIGGRSPGRIRRECCESGDRTGYRSDLEHWEAP